MKTSWMKWTMMGMVISMAGFAAQAEAEDAAGEWTALVRLQSGDAPWQGLDNILVSAPFDAAGQVRLVLDMPEAGPMDGVIVGIVPADRATDASGLLRAIRDGTTVILMGVAPIQEVAGLAGECILVQSLPTEKAWTVEVQTRP